MRLAGSLLRRLGPLLRRQAFRLQSQMDIHPLSLWHNPDFTSLTGGLYPPRDDRQRSVERLSPTDSVRRDMLVLLMRDIEVREIAGSIAELGVYRGETARLLHHYLPHRRLHLFDTFSGFDPRDTAPELETTGSTVPSGQFGDTSLEKVRRHVAPRNGNVVFHPGRFPDSCDPATRRERFALVHLDADLHRPTRAGLRLFYPLVVPGGYLVVHDYNAWHGARQATDEFFRDKAEVAIPMPDKSGSAVILKAG